MNYKYDICIVGGLGHIGLPLGIVFASKNMRVCLQDINKENAKIVESGSMKSAEEKHQYMMYTVACHSALRAGDKLTMAQMEFVIREMESIPNPYACVHGRPTVMTITPAELDKKFKRSGF